MSTIAAGSQPAINGASATGLGAVAASKIAGDAVACGCYSVLELQDVPLQYRSLIYFPGSRKDSTACIVPEGQHHIIVHNGSGNMGIMAFAGGLSELAALVPSLAEKGICNVVRRLSQPIAYVAPPQSRERSSLSALSGYMVSSFFPLYGEPGELARHGLEKALANPVRTLEERMKDMGYSVVNLEAVGR